MTKTKKVLAVLMACVLLMSMVAVTASAASATAKKGQNVTVNSGKGSYADCSFVTNTLVYYAVTPCKKGKTVDVDYYYTNKNGKKVTKTVKASSVITKIGFLTVKKGTSVQVTTY